MSIECDSKDIEMMDVKDSPLYNKESIIVTKKQSIGFTICKYSIVLAPIYIPFTLIYIISGFDLVLSIIGTVIFDIIFMSIFMIYAFRSGKVSDELMKRKV